MLEQGHYQSKLKRGGEEVYLEKRLCKCNMATIEHISHFMVICHKTSTIRERFYDNVITIIHDVNLNVTDIEKITLLLSDHRIMKITANFSINVWKVDVKIYIYI